jgi:L-arabinose isomerase
MLERQEVGMFNFYYSLRHFFKKIQCTAIAGGDLVRAQMNQDASQVDYQLLQLKHKYEVEEKKPENQRKLKAKLETFKTKLKEKEEVGMFNFTIPFDTF